jgi:hypothetical protein
MGGWLVTMRSTHQHFTVEIKRSAGYAGTVTLAAQGVPAGMTVSLSPGATSADMVDVTVATGESIPDGEYPIAIEGVADGLASHTVQVPIMVVGPGGDEFVLTADPESVTVVRGASAATTIVVTRTAAFASGWVGLLAWYAPAGMICAFAPPSGTQFTSSAMTLQVEKSVAADSYDVLVWGMFDTWGDVRWTHVHVTVVDPPGAPGG